MPFSSFKESAQALDRQRLGKQRVEAFQILKALECGPTQYICHLCSSVWHSHYPNCGCNPSNFQSRKTPWYSHPIAKAWKGYEHRLYEYLSVICHEWKNRGYKDSVLWKASNLMIDKAKSFEHSLGLTPPWLGNEKLHLSHRSNLIRKNPSYYRPIFGIDTPDNLPYDWPVK